MNDNAVICCQILVGRRILESVGQEDFMYNPAAACEATSSLPCCFACLKGRMEATADCCNLTCMEIYFIYSFFM